MSVVSVSDFHLHTAISPCAPRDSSALEHVRVAEQFGLAKIGITDHCWDMDVPGAWDFYENQSIGRILTVKDTLPKQRRVQVFIGCEVDMREDCVIAMRPEHMRLFDYVLLPTNHFHRNRNTPDARVVTDEGVRGVMLERFSAAVESPLADYGRIGLCHPFLAAGFGEREASILGGIPDTTYETLFRAAAARGIFIEVNGAMFRGTLLPVESHGLPGEYVRIMSIAHACGCHIYFGSDAHSRAMFEQSHTDPRVELFARVCGFAYEDIV